ncbi:hypothetical protein [Paenilisteria newyorkensis]|uniref:hypothetical protein n=1 Tax=Listeria newyorkensis TaxID=1497681 RepID=UPI000669EA90|nr:hypothetical protein [Listeria newyorkensis]KMT62570.1 hypothetical protein X559_1108 [Listeria newyorkensis]
MIKFKVKVIDLPVRYGDETFNKDEELVINKDEFHESLFEKLEEFEQQVANEFDEFSVEGLIEYAKEHEIDVGKATTRDGILKKILGE